MDISHPQNTATFNSCLNQSALCKSYSPHVHFDVHRGRPLSRSLDSHSPLIALYRVLFDLQQVAGLRGRRCVQFRRPVDGLVSVRSSVAHRSSRDRHYRRQRQLAGVLAERLLGQHRSRLSRRKHRRHGSGQPRRLRTERPPVVRARQL